jgi:hypothetical protein
MSAPVRFEPMAGRISTFRVIFDVDQIGFVRMQDADVWVARTLGNAENAATIRRFSGRDAAAAWLLGKLAA